MYVRMTYLLDEILFAYFEYLNACRDDFRLLGLSLCHSLGDDASL